MSNCLQPQTVTHQAPLSMGLSRQEYWCGLPCPPPGDLPNPEIEPVSLESPAMASKFFTAESQGSPQRCIAKGNFNCLVNGTHQPHLGGLGYLGGTDICK